MRLHAFAPAWGSWEARNELSVIDLSAIFHQYPQAPPRGFFGHLAYAPTRGSEATCGGFAFGFTSGSHGFFTFGFMGGSARVRAD